MSESEYDKRGRESAGLMLWVMIERYYVVVVDSYVYRRMLVREKIFTNVAVIPKTLTPNFSNPVNNNTR